MSKFTQRQNKRLAEIATKTAHILPFSGDTPASKEARIRKAISPSWGGFSYFCTTYFPHIFTRPWCAAHEVMFTETQAAEGIIAITGFRTLGKTVVMGIVYPIWKIARGWRYVIHVSADEDLSAERTALTHHELSNNKRLIADFPDLMPVDIDTSEFYLKNKTYIRARSIKQNIRGTINPKTVKRPDAIIGDDIDKEENQGSQKIGLRKLDKLTQEYAGALTQDGVEPGIVIWLGNLVHPNYAISRYLVRVQGILRAQDAKADIDSTSVLKTPQNTILRFSLENPDGTSAWPEQYPTESLPALRAKYGNTGYQREMLGRPVIEGNIFKNDWFSHWFILPDASKMKRVWLYADPAWGEKGCFKAIGAIAYDGTKFYMEKCWVRQTEQTKFFRYFYDAYQELDRKYKSKFRAAMETTYGQARMLADFDRWCRENGLPVISHRIKRIDNKENKNLRIERTETLIETAGLLFAVGQDTPTLISQFLTYPDGYVDGPDMTAGCLERFSEYDIGKNRVRVRKLTY